MAQPWTRLALKGTSQTIPPVCPNCLGKADQEIRYGYKGIEGWLTRTTYYQTFSYCDVCRPQAASASGLRGWGIFLGFIGFFVMIGAAVAIIDALRDPATGKGSTLSANLSIAGGAAVGILAWVLLYLLVRFVKRQRHPRRPGQAVWGCAAFYTGAPRFGLDSGTAVYIAARPEWIAALAQANPAQLDERTYAQVTGQQRPEPSPASRPFGPG